MAKYIKDFNFTIPNPVNIPKHIESPRSPRDTDDQYIKSKKPSTPRSSFSSTKQSNVSG